MIIVWVPEMKVREIKYAHCHWKQGILERDIIFSWQQVTYIMDPLKSCCNGSKHGERVRAL